MLSRVAENLYWIARYVERAENAIRLLMEAFQLELEIGIEKHIQVRPLETVFRILGCRDQYLTQAGDDPSSVDTIEKTLRFITFERSGYGSILDMIAAARENARSTQETISTDAWSRLNQFYLFLSHPKAPGRFEAGAFRFYQHLKQHCMLFTAIIDGMLPRSEAYHILCIGRYLERVDMLSRMVQAHSLQLPATEGTENLGPQLMSWTSLLRSCAAFEAYLKHSGERIDPPGVVRYLLLEEAFPRSMRFSVMRCLESLQAIAGNNYRSGAERHLGRLDSELRYMNDDDIQVRNAIPFLTSVQETCVTVSNEIHQVYFRT